MKRIGLAITTAVVLATTVPAVAQGYDYDGRGWWGGGRHHQYYRPYRHSYGYYRPYRHSYGYYRPYRHSYGYSHRRYDRSWWGGGRY